MEDDPVFNAGRGAVFNHQGANELDASIMDGRDRSCGAVGGVRTVKNPISLARLVMTRTPHVLLVADGAEKFAAEMGVELVEPSYFSTDDQRESLQRAQQAEAAQGKEAAARQTASDHLGTVGCVALDRHSNLAAGTSTGGLTNKRYGRLGDSPVIGAGTFADNATCAVSCTGRGEDFIRNAIAFHISALMQYDHKSIQQAVESVVTDKQHPIEGGIIAVSREGAITMQFNTAGMSRGAADSAGRFEIALGK
jgi:beta-aspartyl-peptidase (threonine type)